MSSNPSSKWFWNDWDNDSALRLCSLAAQGLWMRMLSIAARAVPIGYVIINGRPADATDLAHVTGASEAEVRCLIDELEDRRIFSRDRHHRIYNRRMVRDERSRLAAIKTGKEGGNPELRRGTVPKEERVRRFRRSDNPTKTKRIFAKSAGRCHWCSRELVWDGRSQPALFHVDHVIAVRDGGTNDEANLVAACAECNHRRARVRVGSTSVDNLQVIDKIGENDPTITRQPSPLYPSTPPPIPKEKNPEAIASGVAEAPPDPIKDLWNRGKAILGNTKSAGSIIGKMRREHGDAVVLQAIVAAETELPSDPASFFIGCCNLARANGNGRLTPANERFIAGREATYRAVLAAEERDRAAATGDETGDSD